MRCRTLISGGYVIDPARGIDKQCEVLIEGDRIIALDSTAAVSPDVVINAGGCLVVPGLIDYHTHVFYGATENGCPPDIGTLPNCVTTVVDSGSAGTANYEIFRNNVIANSVVRIKSFLNVSPTGQVTMKYDENHDPKFFDEDKMKFLFEKYPDELLGLKLRMSKEVVGHLGLFPLVKALEIAKRLSCSVAVHATNPPGDTEEMVKFFRSGDIFVHVYHGKGSTIIGGDSHVLPEIKHARERGVVFDAANGRNHFAFETAEVALADDFAPDIISSDLGWATMFQQPVFGLPWLMSKYLALGMPLYKIVAACTSTPARLMGMQGEIGTLSPGSCADIGIIRLIDQRCEFRDVTGATRVGQQMLLPQATIRAGRVVFRQLNF